MFYLKLAGSTIRKNKLDYVPFMFSIVVMVALNLVMRLINASPSINSMFGSASIKQLLGFGSIIIMIFSAVFLFYTHNFLLKRRKHEFGLFNILGMTKGDLLKVTFLELLISFGASLVLGVVAGVVFAKAMLLLLMKLIGGSHFVLGFDAASFVLVIIYFLFILLVLFAINVVAIFRTKPVDLLNATNEGEREPKAKFILTLIGLVMLGAGYYISLTVQSPVAAVMKFFVAVILVILATYLLFLAGSITILKMMKKRPSFYTPNRFIMVSNMIFRMKQNALGLANIAILSTMALVTISATSALYFGGLDIAQNLFPKDYEIQTVTGEKNTEEAVKQYVAPALDQFDLKMKNVSSYRMSDDYMAFRTGKNEFATWSENMKYDADDLATVTFIPYEDYLKLGNKPVDLSANDIIVMDVSRRFDSKNLQLGTKEFHVAKVTDKIKGIPSVRRNSWDYILVVVKDETVVKQFDGKFTNPAGEPLKANFTRVMDFNLAGSKKNREAFEKYAKKNLPDVYVKAQQAANLRSGLSGFLFIGIILGLSFIVGTGLIIYYKQISEGREDKARFEILQQVGMSHEEVAKTIHSQVLFVFFLPIVVAIIHVLFSLPMIVKILAAFTVVNTTVIAISMTLTSLIVIAIYFAIYLQTSKIYIGLVERK
jgi:putative ABC transport system permease protein